MLEIRTLGGLSLRKNGEAIKDLGSRKAEAILVYVAIGGRPHNRNVLATLLWPESTENQALTSLASTLAQEGEEKTAIELLRYVQRHSQTPALYVEQAARRFVHLDQTSAQNGSAEALENVEMDEVINRLLNRVALHSTVEPD